MPAARPDRATYDGGRPSRSAGHIGSLARGGPSSPRRAHGDVRGLSGSDTWRAIPRQMQVRWKNHRRICATFCHVQRGLHRGPRRLCMVRRGVDGREVGQRLPVGPRDYEGGRQARTRRDLLHRLLGERHLARLRDHDHRRRFAANHRRRDFLEAVRRRLVAQRLDQQAERLGHVPHRREHRRDGDVRRSGRGGRQPDDRPVPGRWRCQHLARRDLPQRLGNRSPDIQISGAARRPRYRRDQRELRGRGRRPQAHPRLQWDDQRQGHERSGSPHAWRVAIVARPQS